MTDVEFLEEIKKTGISYEFIVGIAQAEMVYRKYNWVKNMPAII